MPKASVELNSYLRQRHDALNCARKAWLIDQPHLLDAHYLKCCADEVMLVARDAADYGDTETLDRITSQHLDRCADRSRAEVFVPIARKVSGVYEGSDPVSASKWAFYAASSLRRRRRFEEATRAIQKSCKLALRRKHDDDWFAFALCGLAATAGKRQRFDEAYDALLIVDDTGIKRRLAIRNQLRAEFARLHLAADDKPAAFERLQPDRQPIVPETGALFPWAVYTGVCGLTAGIKPRVDSAYHAARIGAALVLVAGGMYGNFVEVSDPLITLLSATSECGLSTPGAGPALPLDHAAAVQIRQVRSQWLRAGRVDREDGLLLRRRLALAYRYRLKTAGEPQEMYDNPFRHIYLPIEREGNP